MARIAVFVALLSSACAHVREEPDAADTGFDPGFDTGFDPGLDPAGDTDPDTDFDTGVDAGPDAIDDTPFDPGWDPGTDPGVDTGADPGTDPGTDTGSGWGVGVCGRGTTIPDRGSYTDSVTIPALGNVRVIELDIAINDRVILGSDLPFDDLVVSLTSPGGTARVFWDHFYSDDTGGFFPDYAFPDRWLLPVWWETPVGGTWTLDIDDTALTLRTTTLASWCLTPLDPAPYASHPIHAHLHACSTHTGSIPDCDMTTPDCPGDEYFEFQIDDLVQQATGSPTLSLSVSHSRPSDLRIVLTSANGYEQTIHDRTSSIPSTVTLTGMAAEWMTGRYQLHVEDHVEGTTGSVSSWCIDAN